MDKWPMMMKVKTAAAYCDMSVSAFQREVTAGNLPGPASLGRVDHWHRPTLDRALSLIAGEDIPEFEREFEKRYGSQAA